MPAPLSLDLRQRIVDAYLGGEGSQKEIARRFDVSKPTVTRLVKRYRTTGSVAPSVQQHGPRPRIADQHRKLFDDWLGEDPSLTQSEMAQRFTEATGKATSQQSVSRALARFRLTRKKRPAERPNKSVLMLPKNAPRS